MVEPPVLVLYFSISPRAEFVTTICQIAGDHLWSSSAEEFFSQASKDGNVIKWSDLLDFYINLDKVKTFLTERKSNYKFFFSGEKQSVCFPANTPRWGL